MAEQGYTAAVQEAGRAEMYDAAWLMVALAREAAGLVDRGLCAMWPLDGVDDTEWLSALSVSVGRVFRGLTGLRREIDAHLARQCETRGIPTVSEVVSSRLNETLRLRALCGRIGVREEASMEVLFRQREVDFDNAQLFVHAVGSMASSGPVEPAVVEPVRGCKRRLVFEDDDELCARLGCNETLTASPVPN
jgi:hypothetical protein